MYFWKPVFQNFENYHKIKTIPEFVIELILMRLKWILIIYGIPLGNYKTQNFITVDSEFGFERIHSGTLQIECDDICNKTKLHLTVATKKLTKNLHPHFTTF